MVHVGGDRRRRTGVGQPDRSSVSAHGVARHNDSSRHKLDQLVNFWSHQPTQPDMERNGRPHRRARHACLWSRSGSPVDHSLPPTPEASAGSSPPLSAVRRLRCCCFDVRIHRDAWRRYSLSESKVLEPPGRWLSGAELRPVLAGEGPRCTLDVYATDLHSARTCHARCCGTELDGVGKSDLDLTEPGRADDRSGPRRRAYFQSLNLKPMP